MTKVIVINQVGLAYVTDEYFNVVSKVAKKLGYSSANHFATYRYHVINEQVVGHAFAFFAFASLIPTLSPALKRAKIDPNELVHSVFTPSQKTYDLDSELV